MMIHVDKRYVVCGLLSKSGLSRLDDYEWDNVYNVYTKKFFSYRATPLHKWTFRLRLWEGGSMYRVGLELKKTFYISPKSPDKKYFITEQFKIGLHTNVPYRVWDFMRRWFQMRSKKRYTCITKDIRMTIDDLPLGHKVEWKIPWSVYSE